MLKKVASLTLVMLAIALMIGSASAALAAPIYQVDPAGQDMSGVVNSPDQLSDTFAMALQVAALQQPIQFEGPVTIFAPNREAIEALPQATVNDLMANPVKLEQVILNHIVAGEVTAADLAKLDTVTSLLGEPLKITHEDDTLWVNNARILATDGRIDNAVIHIIDAVLLPSSYSPPEK